MGVQAQGQTTNSDLVSGRRVSLVRFVQEMNPGCRLDRIHTAQQLSLLFYQKDEIASCCLRKRTNGLKLLTHYRPTA